MEFIRLDLNICIDLIVINTAFILQRSHSFLGIVLVLPISQDAPFCTQKPGGTWKLRDVAALRSASHRPNEASWHQWALCLPTQKINFEWFPKHACTNYFLVCKGRWNIYKICLKCTQVQARARERSGREKMSCSSLLCWDVFPGIDWGNTQQGVAGEQFFETAWSVRTKLGLQAKCCRRA